MEFDFAQLEKNDRYKLMTATIVPRPIALTVTVDRTGAVNAAPFSFFNGFASAPPLLVLGLQDFPPGTQNDTARNIRETGEFVVNLVDEALAERMNICAIPFPHGINELTQAGLTAVPVPKVKPPRVAEAPVAFACRRTMAIEVGTGTVLAVGEILGMYIRDDLIDPGRLHVRTEAMQLIGRMHGPAWYARTHDLFDMPRPTLAEWQAREG